MLQTFKRLCKHAHNRLFAANAFRLFRKQKHARGFYSINHMFTTVASSRGFIACEHPRLCEVVMNDGTCRWYLSRHVAL